MFDSFCDGTGSVSKNSFFSKSKHCGSSFGFSIVELMIAAAIFALIGASIASFMRKQGQTLNTMRYMSTRDAFRNRLMSIGGSPKALRVSVEQTENAYMKGCLSGQGCRPNQKVPFALYDAMGALVAGAGEHAPVRYTIDGTRCSAATSQCPMEVFSEVSVVCKSNVCGIPTDVKVFFTIRQAPGVKIPGSAELKAASDSAPSVQTMSIAALTSGVACYGKGEVLRGIMPDGRPDCAPILGSLGLHSIASWASEHKNPNAKGGVDCGWAPVFAGQPRMQHVVGSVCCGENEIAMGGGGVCNFSNGGFMESSKPQFLNGKSCWFVDCCKYANYDKSPIWVQCVAAPGIKPTDVMPAF